MEKYTFTIRTSFIPPNGRIPASRSSRRTFKKNMRARQKRKILSLLTRLDILCFPSKGLRLRQKRLPKMAVLLDRLSMARQKKTGLK